MSSMQAALGLAQLERVDELVAGKRRIFGWYRDAFANSFPGTLNPDIEGLHNSYWMSTVILDEGLGLTKEQLVPRLREQASMCAPSSIRSVRSPRSRMPRARSWRAPETAPPTA